MKNTLSFYASLLLIGIISGLVGVCLTHLLHFIQHHAFFYTEQIHSFREGVENTPALWRLGVLLLCGSVVGVGWYSLHSFGTPLISIQKSLENAKQGVPFFSTVSHALLQIITVGLGSPLGREVAPREMSVAFASLIVRQPALSQEEAKLLLACASGAGLTAVYNVPFAATVFILETMVLVFNPRALLSALFTVAVATVVARLFLGDLVQYAHLPRFNIDQSLLVLSPLIGLLMGLGANLFQFTTQKFPLVGRKDKRIIPLAVLLFGVIGALAIYQPDILGNGKAGNQLTFGAMINWQESLTLLSLKWVAVLLALAVGAYGGLITPSMMLGSTAAYALALGWNALFPQYPLSAEAAAIVGASAFLGISLKMPLTAIVFLLELTRSSAEMLMPICLAMSTAVIADRIWKAKQAV